MVVGNPLRSRRGGCQIEQLLAGKTLEQAGADKIAHRLETESVDSIVCMLNRLFASLDYVNYPVRNEASLRAFIQVFFSGAGLEPIVEHHNAHGRSDLEVRAGNKNWILEFKISHKNEDTQIKLDEAVHQIEERKYGEQISSFEKIRVALVYSLDKREFVRWKEC